MTKRELLDLLTRLPDEAQITVTVSKRDLVAALEDQDPDPERLVGTTWLSKHFGMSRKWWALAAPDVPGAFPAGGERAVVLACRRGAPLLGRVPPPPHPDAEHPPWPEDRPVRHRGRDGPTRRATVAPARSSHLGAGHENKTSAPLISTVRLTFENYS